MAEESGYITVTHEQLPDGPCGHRISAVGDLGPRDTAERSRWTYSHPVPPQTADEFLEELGHAYGRIFGGVPVRHDLSEVSFT